MHLCFFVESAGAVGAHTKTLWRFRMRFSFSLLASLVCVSFLQADVLHIPAATTSSTNAERFRIVELNSITLKAGGRAFDYSYIDKATGSAETMTFVMVGPGCPLTEDDCGTPARLFGWPVRTDDGWRFVSRTGHVFATITDANIYPSQGWPVVPGMNGPLDYMEKRCLSNLDFNICCFGGCNGRMFISKYCSSRCSYTFFWELHYGCEFKCCKCLPTRVVGFMAKTAGCYRFVEEGTGRMLYGRISTSK